MGCDAVASEVSRYNWDRRVMLAIAIAENRTCDTTNHNLSSSEDHGSCIGSYGVLQVGCIHYAPGEDRDDLRTNVKIAYRVWQQQGYEAWTQYRNGAYKEHLR